MQQGIWQQFLPISNGFAGGFDHWKASERPTGFDDLSDITDRRDVIGASVVGQGDFPS